MHFPFDLKALGMSEGEFNTLVSTTLGFIVPWLTALANQKKWSSGLKTVIFILICLMLSVLQVGVLGQLEGLPVFKALVLIIISSQSIYKAKFVKQSTDALEEKTSK